MSVAGIGTHNYPAWRDTGRKQRNHPGMDFENRMADIVGINTSKSSGKTSGISKRDNYVGGDAANLYDMGIDASNYQTWLSKFNNAKLLDTGTELLNHFSNERILSDEEVEQVGSQESETKTEIIVKPDGSRVLVMTMSIGGMETTMSLEISKPTDVPNENSKQDIDHNMPTSENNTVSDETRQRVMPIISASIDLCQDVR